jgi:hypothetical protein
MTRKVINLLPLLALLVLPAWAESPAPNSTPMAEATAQAEVEVVLDDLFLPAPLPMGCLSECMMIKGWPNIACLQRPPAQQEQCLSDFEDCRHSC